MTPSMPGEKYSPKYHHYVSYHRNDFPVTIIIISLLHFICFHSQEIDMED